MESETRAAPRVRFAPSPTGFLHVGSARTALFNWLFARANGGTYLLRIEDTDEERNREDWAEGIVTALDWLGIPPDEPLVRQSSRGADHQAAIEQLWDGGYLYACDCTREEVLARTKDLAIPGYDGHCRDRGLGREGRALRFKVPDVGTVVVRDLIRGDVSFPLSAIEDFVVVKSNGGPLFALANVVDDRSMRISHVIRGEDLLPSAPKALLLWQALDGMTIGADGEPERAPRLPLPAYAHLPMLVNEKREKISKRRSDVAVEFYSSEGFLPSAFANYLALLGWGHPQGIEIFDIADVAPVFALEDVHHAPAFFDVAKLRHVNAEHLRALEPEAFVDAALPWVMAEAEVLDNPMLIASTSQSGTPWPREHFDPVAFRRIAPHVQQRISTLSEVPHMVDFLFLEHPIVDADDWKVVAGDESAKSILDLAIAAYESCEFEPEELHKITAEIGESVGRKLAKAQAPIRVAITGKRVGPPLFESMAILGREKVLERLRGRGHGSAQRAEALSEFTEVGAQSSMAAPVAAVAGFLVLRKIIRIVLKTLLVILVVAIVYFAVTVVQVWLTSRQSDPEKSQAIVIMGAAQYNGVPSPDLLARLQDAYSLYREHFAPLIVATGAKEPGDHYTEAESEANWLEQHGVPTKAVIQVGGRTTWQNLSLASGALKHRGLDKVLIATDGFHEDRCLAIASELGLQPKPVPATNSPIRGWSTFPYFMKESAAVAIGRVIGYSHLEWLHDVS